MKSIHSLRSCLLVGVSALNLATLVPQAHAQTASPSAGAPTEVEEVYVTARKRIERLIDVPVAVSEVSAASLEKYATTDLNQLTQQVPVLNMNRIATGQGGSFLLRGLGSGADTGVEQAVALNFDGIQVSRARFVRAALFDVQSIEVLKGPQALFFGKNSPAGLVSITSVSPGDELEGYARAGYSHEYRKRFAEGAISIPISESLTTRVAARYDSEDGFLKNIGGPLLSPFDCAPVPGPCQPVVAPGNAQGDRVQDYRSIFVRGTARWRPTETFDALLKLSYGDYKDNGDVANLQRVCQTTNPIIAAGGISAVDTNADCRFDRQTTIGSWPVEIGQTWPEQQKGGRPFSTFQPLLGSLNMNYTLGDLTFNSLTGYYEQVAENEGDSDTSTFVQLAGANNEYSKAWSQEFRVTSQFAGAVNFMAGLYYERSHRRYENGGKILPQAAATKVDVGRGKGYDSRSGRSNDWLQQSRTYGTTYSFFGQATWKITDQLTLDAGARWIQETKDGEVQNVYVNNSIVAPVRNAVFLQEGVPLRARIKDDNISPEVTLTYKPQSNMTLYAAYKTGFQSGGMTNPGLPAPQTSAQALIFEPMEAKGAEVGFKFSVFDGALRGDITAYNYKFDNLQVQSARSVETAPGVISVVYSISNAASAYTRGMEAQGTWRTPIEGLETNAFLSYNLGSYEDYRAAPCYVGQTAALGCLSTIVDGRSVAATDLTDSQLPNAPMWTARLGTSYERELGTGISLGLSADANYTSSQYLTRPASVFFDIPGKLEDGRRDALWLFNASARIFSNDARWEAAIIARNLGNELYPIFVNNPAGTPASLATQISAAIGDPRQFIFQLTYRY